MEDLELEYVTIYYHAPIMHMIFKEGVELGMPEISELTACCEKLSGGATYFVLSDVRAGMTVTHEGRRLAGNAKKAPLHRGSAVLVTNALYQVAATLFSKFEKPEYPYRVFTDEGKALKWLLQLATKGIKKEDLDIDINLSDNTGEQPGASAL